MDLSRPSAPEGLPQPKVISRPEHTISRKEVDPDALKVLYRLHRHGFLGYLVGGSVRDLLLGKKPKDYDIGTDAHPNQVYKLFRNSRIIGRRFRLVQVIFRGQKIFEVSTFRRSADPDDEEAVLIANNTFGTPAEDALRRDLTINALFYNIADFSIVDYVDGMHDLKAGIIRGVGNARLRFHRDPVRVLRAVRHAARTGFLLDPETRFAVETVRHELPVCPTSRIRDELMRDLAGGDAYNWLGLAHDTRVLYSLLPTLEPFYGPTLSLQRRRARRLLAKVDARVKGGAPPDPSVVLALLFWPVLEEKARDVEFGRGRPGRARWGAFVHEILPPLVAPVAFAKRVMERTHQIAGVMSFLRPGQGGGLIPKKITEKGYFPVACQLAEMLGGDLRPLVRGPIVSKNVPSPKRRRRRRRRRKPARSSNDAQPKG